MISDAEIIRSILGTLPPREREALRRFYVLEQDAKQISQDMGFDETALRELKARTKKQFLLWKHRLD